MGKRKDMGAALAVLASVAGVGYASGRELVLFFAQAGRAAWIGIPVASVIFGLLMGLTCRWASKGGAGGFAGLCRERLPPRAARVARLLHGLLLALAAAAMLRAAGRVGELALPVRHGALWGAGLALFIALLVNLARQRPMPWLGFLVVAAGLAFYGALALDPRPPRLYLRGEVALALEDSVPAALVLALLYGAMNAGVAAGVAARFGRGGASPIRVGALCGGLLCALLLCANAALARGGRELLAQALPTVLLSARWGVVGFWACAGFQFLCAATTLAAAVGEAVGVRS